MVSTLMGSPALRNFFHCMISVLFLIGGYGVLELIGCLAQRRKKNSRRMK